MFAKLKTQLTAWTEPRSVESGWVTLTRRRVYILPTRQGAVFGVVLVMMLLGAINYSLSLGYVLTFLLTALLFNAMLFTWRNLAGLRLSSGRAPPVFAGGDAVFTLNIANDSRETRYAVGLAHERKDITQANYVNAPAGATVPISIAIPAPHRGRMRAGRLTLFTRYPLGFYFAWSYARPDTLCIVYPRPAQAGMALPRAEASQGTGATHGDGQEDFSGLRDWHTGDSPRHIAWKVAARGLGLHTKLFSGEAASEIWLAWDQLPPSMDTEVKLSRLTRWVLDADAAHVAYGLRLPGVALPLSMGEAHRERCLEALALHDIVDNLAESTAAA